MQVNFGDNIGQFHSFMEKYLLKQTFYHKYRHLTVNCMFITQKCYFTVIIQGTDYFLLTFFFGTTFLQPAFVSLIFFQSTLVRPNVCPTMTLVRLSHLANLYIKYFLCSSGPLFNLFFVWPILCLTHSLSDPSFVRPILCPTHPLSDPSFVRPILCPTHPLSDL